MNAQFEGGDYQSKFDAWDERASVRVKPKRALGLAPGQLYFPPELVPVTQHPNVLAAPPDLMDKLLLQSLYQYLWFTIELERTSVLPVTARIAGGDSGVPVPAAMRADAFAITTDEAWHAQFSYEFLAKLESTSGVTPRLPEQPHFARELGRLRDRVEPGLHGALDLLFGFVSETLISTKLSQIPKDSRLPKGVREIVADHAEDEGRHHSYFRDFLRFLWPALSARERAEVGPLLPEMITAFLAPDPRGLSTALCAAGMTTEAADQVVRESLTQTSFAKDAKLTVRYLEQIDAMDAPCIRDSFLESGLLRDD